MMDTLERQQTLAHITEAHSLVEKNYLLNRAVPQSEDWLNKRRLLLADLSLHLADACVKEEMNMEKIKRYLYSILTIADDFVPEASLKQVAERILPGATT